LTRLKYGDKEIAIAASIGDSPEMLFNAIAPKEVGIWEIFLRKNRNCEFVPQEKLLPTHSPNPKV
jgi:hypothetical protein